MAKALEYWKRHVQSMIEEIRFGEPPSFALDRLHDFEKLFFKDGVEIDLDPEQFIDAFTKMLPGMNKRPQWNRLFVDIDADRGGTVSWDEFTNFMINQSIASRSEYNRSKEYVPQHLTTKLNQAHKDGASHMLSCAKTGQIITAGDDGYVKVWNADTSYALGIQNSKNSAATKISTHGTQVFPICDVVLGSGGSVCAVTSVDKCINLYQTDTMQLVRRYIGRNLLNDVNIPPAFEPGLTKPVDTVVLMGMLDTVSTCDMSSSSAGKENFFIGHMDGSMSIYPTMRHSLIPDIRPASIVKLHTDGCIHKLRYVPACGVISSGWDKLVLMSDPETGQVTAKFNEVGALGHMKFITDFCFNAELKLLTTISSDKDACLWTPQMSSPAAKLQGHVAALIGLTSHDKDYQLMTLSSDNCIKIWDTRTFKHFQTLLMVNSYIKPTTIHYDETNEQLLGLAGVPSAWRPRRASTSYPPSYKGHIEPVVSMCYNKELDTLVTSDICTSMSWSLRFGERRIAWETVKENQQCAAACLDNSARRLYLFTKTGSLMIYNHRSGQLLREETLVMPDPVVALSVCRPPNYMYIVVVTFEAVFVLNEIGDSITVEKISGGKSALRYTCAAVGPHDSNGVPIVLCGTASGAIVGISVIDKVIAYELSSGGLYSAKQRDPLQEYIVTQGKIVKQMECIQPILQRGMALGSTGDKYLHLFVLGSKAFYAATIPLTIAPTAMTLNNAETHLFCGDEFGVIAVYDISVIPKFRMNSQLKGLNFEVISTFNTHRCSINRVLCIPHKALLVCLGSDTSVVLVSWTGAAVGTLGLNRWTPVSDAPITIPPGMLLRRSHSGKAFSLITAAAVAANPYPPTGIVRAPSKQHLNHLQRSSSFSTPHLKVKSSAFITTLESENYEECPAELGEDAIEKESDSSNDDDDRDVTGQLSRLIALRDRNSPNGLSKSSRFICDARTALTPTVGHRSRSMILKISESELSKMSLVRPPTRQINPELLPPRPLSVSIIEPALAHPDKSEVVHHRAVSPPKYYGKNSLLVRSFTPDPIPLRHSQSPISTMRKESALHESLNSSASVLTPVPVDSSSRLRSDTGKQVYAAKALNPKGWTNSVSSFLPVAELPKGVLESPLLGIKGAKAIGGRIKRLAPL